MIDKTKTYYVVHSIVMSCHEDENGDGVADYSGNLYKKVKEIADKEFLMSDSLAPSVSYTRNAIETILNGQGSIAQAYETAVSAEAGGAIAAFSTFVSGGGKSIVENMRTPEKLYDATPKQERSADIQFGGRNSALIFYDEKNLKTGEEFILPMGEYDINHKFKSAINTFNDAVDAANNTLVNSLMNLLFVKVEGQITVTGDGNIDWSDVSGLRGAVQGTGSYYNEGGVNALQNEVFSLVKKQKDFFEDAQG